MTKSSREGRRKRRPRLPLIAIGAVVLALLWAGTFTSWGWMATAYIFVVLDFYIGVVVLVTLSLTVMAGLASTDRFLLKIRHRVLFQSAHRVTAIIAVVALGVHIAVKVLEAHASIGDAFVPFFSQGRSLFIGFGTIAAYLLLTACWSGMARTRFIGRRRPWRWRLVHCSAYLSWPVALVHGLSAGRAAAGWVTVSYIVCVVLVGLGLLVRLFSKFGRYSTGVKATTRAVGVNIQTAIIPRIQDMPAPGRPLAGTTTGSQAVVDPAQYARTQARESGSYPVVAGPPVASYPTPDEGAVPWRGSPPAPADPQRGQYAGQNQYDGQNQYAGQNQYDGPGQYGGPGQYNGQDQYGGQDQYDVGGWRGPGDGGYPDEEEQSWAPPGNGRRRLRLVTDDETNMSEAPPSARGRHSAPSDDEDADASGDGGRNRGNADEPGERRSGPYRYAPTSDGWAPPAPKPEFRSRQRRRG